MTKAAQRQFKVTISAGSPALTGAAAQACNRTWATRAGGDQATTANKIYDGGDLRPDILTSPPEVSNITITRAYDPDIDLPMLNALRPLLGRWSTTISVSSLDKDMNVIAKGTVTYPESVLVSMKEPDFNAASGDASMIELEFAVPNIVNQGQ